MPDTAKTRAQLLQEVAALHKQISKLLFSESEYQLAKETLREAKEKYRSLVETTRNALLRQEIAERGWTEGVLRRSEEYFRLLIENASDLIIVLDSDGTIRYQSPSAERVLGNRPADVIGKRGFEFVHAEDLPSVITAFADALKRPGVTAPIEVRVRHQDGSWRILEAIGNNLLDHPLVAGVIVTTRDITEHKQMEEALRASEERYRELFENANDIIYTRDLAGQFTSINKAGERVSGYTHEELLSCNLTQLVAPDSLARAREMLERKLAGEVGPTEYELEILTKDGRRVLLEVSSRLIYEEGKPVAVQGTARDITQRKRLEEALRQSKAEAEAANRAKSEFLASMSHELRTPLSAILGYTSLLLEQTFGSLQEEQTDTLRRIDRNARELFDLITAVLDLSRLEPGRLPVEVREVQVPELVEELKAETQEVRERSRLEFVWQVEGELPLLQTDPGKVKVVVKNLIGNAVKFTKTGSVTVDAHSRRGGVEISVTDTGIGISPEALALIFEPFRQVDSSGQQRGTGLGLHIVKRLLELLGGTVTVESEVGRGSTFRVWLPRESPPLFSLPVSL